MTGDAAHVAEEVLVDGADALTYLDSQCTQDLAGLEVGDTAMTLLLDPAGELVTVARVRRTDTDTLVVEVPAGLGDRAAARLRRFAIRASLTVHDPVPTEGTSELFEERARIEAGVPGAAEVARGLVPHGLSRAFRERCVSFTKGCYPGQELVARMEARGATPPYVLRRLTAEREVAPGDRVGDDRFEGVVTSVAPDPGAPGWNALSVLHRRDAEGATVEVRTSVGDVLARLS